MKKDKITVADIAKKAGVSPATVSRVLRHRELVKSETIQQVENAMSALGCLLEKGTIAAATEQPLIILNVPELDNVFYLKVIDGALVSAKAHGYRLLINDSPLDRSSIYSFINLLKQVHAAGVILLNHVSKEQLDMIHSVVPLVQCSEYNEHADYPYVSIDDYSAATSAAEYIVSCNCNKLAMINGPMSFKYAVKRQEGFLDTLRKKDISVRPDWIVSLPEVNYQMAYSAVCRLLNNEIRPNAFFVISDVFAAAVIRAAKRFDLRIPEDIIVVGFDNLDISIMTCPTITTVNQPSFQLGYSACELLLDSINHPDMFPKSLILDTELIIRESSAKI